MRSDSMWTPLLILPINVDGQDYSWMCAFGIAHFALQHGIQWAFFFCFVCLFVLEEQLIVRGVFQ